jgi:hypothetical protein
LMYWRKSISSSIKTPLLPSLRGFSQPLSAVFSSAARLLAQPLGELLSMPQPPVAARIIPGR